MQPRDIDSVKHGQMAIVRLTALNQRITPMVSGKVIYLSADTLADERNPSRWARPTSMSFLRRLNGERAGIFRASARPGCRPRFTSRRPTDVLPVHRPSDSRQHDARIPGARRNNTGRKGGYRAYRHHRNLAVAGQAGGQLEQSRRGRRAQIFLSWKWLSGWLSSIPDGGSSGGEERDAANLPYVAFFPLRLQWATIEIRRLGQRWQAISAPTIPASEARGEHKVIPAFARTIRQMNWARLHLDNVWDVRAALAVADGMLRGQLPRPKSTGHQDRWIDNTLPLRHAAEGLERISTRRTNTRQKIHVS